MTHRLLGFCKVGPVPYGKNNKPKALFPQKDLKAQWAKAWTFLRNWLQASKALQGQSPSQAQELDAGLHGGPRAQRGWQG